MLVRSQINEGASYVAKSRLLSELEDVAQPDDSPDTASDELVYHFRLRDAAMFKDPLSGLDLSGPAGRITGMVKRGLGKAAYQRVRQAMSLGRIEQYDPTRPDMTETPPPSRKDLRKTREFQFLNDPKAKTDELVKYVQLIVTKGRRAVLPLKIMHHLETTSQNHLLHPRPELVDAIEAGLKTLKVTDYRITNEEEDGILQINTTPEEYLASVQ